MFKFLFGGRKAEVAVKIETQRETFERLVEEINAAIDQLADKPKVTIDPATGHILPETPEQFPDEALALPRPEESKAAVAEKIAEGDAAARPAREEPPLAGAGTGAERQDSAAAR